MRIHENGFSFFGGAQRGNAAAGQALRNSCRRAERNPGLTEMKIIKAVIQTL